MMLHAFGCSLTYGQALEDCQGKSKDHAGPTPSKFAWPHVVADQLNISCKNHSEPGASNKLILDRILKSQIQSSDIVIVQWSYLARWCMFRGRKAREDLGPWKTSHPFYKYIWNPTDCIFNNKVVIDYAWLHLKTIGCKFVFAHIEKGLGKSYWVEDDIEYMFDENIFDHSQFIDKSINNFRIDLAQDDHHPGKQSYSQFADYLIDLPIFAELTNTKSHIQ